MHTTLSAIILGKYDLKEYDRLYTLYTKDVGLIRVVAVGVRRSKAKLAGLLETFTHADISIVKKHGLGKVTGVIVEENFTALKTDENALSSIFRNSQIFKKIVHHEDQDKEIFLFLKDYLSIINTWAEKDTENLNILRLVEYGFVLQLFQRLGYGLEVDCCVKCTETLTKRTINTVCLFSAKNGGILCTQCSRHTKDGIVITENTIKILRIIFHNKLGSLQKLNIPEIELNRLERIIQIYVQWIL